LFAGLSPEIKGFLHFSSPWSIIVLSGWILPSAIGAVLQGVLMGRLRFAPVAFAMAGGTGFGRLALGVAMVAAGFGVEGAVAASVVGQVVMTVALLPLLRHELFSGSGDKQKERIGGRQTLLSLVALGGYAVLMSMDTVLARHYLPSREAGWYTAAATVGKIAMFLPGAVALVAFPRFSVGDGRSREARSALRFALPVILALGLLAALIMLAFSSVVVSVLFGASYRGADGTLGILGFEAMLLGLLGLLMYFQLARRSTNSLVPWSAVLVAALTIVLFHRDPQAIALDMVVAVGSALALSLPAAGRSLLASHPSTSPETDGRPRLLLLNWRDSEHRRAGGSEVYAERVAQAWASQGYDVTLLTRSFAGAANQVKRNGYTLLRRGNTLTMQWHAWCYYRQHAHELDSVVEFVNALPFLTPLYVRKTPAVALFHQTTEEIWAHELPQPLAAIGRYLLEPIWLRCYRRFTVLAVSESTRSALARRGLRDISLAPEGADTIISLADKPTKEQIPTVLFVGRLTSNKRPDHALEAFRELKRHLPDTALWVVGDGPMLPTLKAKAPAGTTFFGRVSETKKRALMARAHVLVATSVREGWGLTVSEAALCGTRAVGYDVAGLRDSVGAAGGVLVEPQPRALAGALAQLLPAWVKDYGPVPADVGVCSWEDVAASVTSALSGDRTRGSVPRGWARPKGVSQLAWASYLSGPDLGAPIGNTGRAGQTRSVA
jgi:glycosyltransferase involved in cell wall biosynthesis